MRTDGGGGCLEEPYTAGLTQGAVAHCRLPAGCPVLLPARQTAAHVGRSASPLHQMLPHPKSQSRSKQRISLEASR